MKSNTYSRFIRYGVVLVIIIAVAVFVTTLVSAVGYDPQSQLAAVITQPVATTTAARYPSRLLVPAINIDAHVQKTGITVAGNMGTPTNFTDVAWYEYGVIPGDSGDAVIDGHVDNGLALAGVFKHLNSIKVGDDVYVINVAGDELHFVVSAIDSYDYKNVPVDQIFNGKGAKNLILITCGGTWVPGERTYDQRIVVTATLSSS
jgi:LPXTG-site transpeptidase (sortase) family protein